MLTMENQVISIICPLENGSDFIKNQIENVFQICEKNYYQFEIILINDGLDDAASQAINQVVHSKKEGLRLIRLIKHVGFDIAVRAGLDSCIGDYVVVIDITTDPESCIIPLVQKCLQTQHVILGTRKNVSSDSLVVRYGRRLFYFFCDQFLCLDFPKNTTYLAAFPRKILTFIISNQDKFCFIKLITAQIGFTTEMYEYNFIATIKHPSRSFWKSVDLSIKVVTGQTHAPLRIVAVGALFSSGLNFIYVVYVSLIFLFKDSVAAGWTTLSLQLSVGFFILFLILAIISEYLSILLSQVRPTALYHVLDEQKSGLVVAHADRRNIIYQSTEEIEEP